MTWLDVQEGGIQHGITRRFQNQSFAARQLDVSHADIVSFRCGCANDCFQTLAKNGHFWRPTTPIHESILHADSQFLER